jgi:hypothetical protein
MTLDRMPLPRFWYLPRGEKAAVVMTGDDHERGGTTGQFDLFKAAAPAGCSVEDWECVRATSYVYPGTPISDAAAAGYQSNGFEIALHLSTGCDDFTPERLADDWDTQLPEFRATWPSLAAPRTNRTHCVAWSDWASEPKLELQHDVRLDTTYYYWPGAWVQDRPGLFTGSGFPMRFADVDGALIDVYQATTQLNDELDGDQANPAYIPAHIKALLDGALGPDGYYGVFTANMHTDYANHEGANAIVAEAVSRDVPVVSAAQMLTWLDGRNGSSFGSLSFSGGRLRFTVARAAGARGLLAMVPATAGTGGLLGLTRDSAPVSTSLRTVKGVTYAAFDAAPGTYVATYPAPPASAPPASPPPASAPPASAPPAVSLGPSGPAVPAQSADRPAPAAGPGTPAGSGSPERSGADDSSKPRVRIRGRTLRVSRTGILALAVTCPRAEVRCILDLRLRRGDKQLAASRFVVAGGRTAKVSLALRRDVRSALRRSRSVGVLAVIDARDAADNRRTTRTRLRVLAPRRR